MFLNMGNKRGVTPSNPDSDMDPYCSRFRFVTIHKSNNPHKIGPNDGPDKQKSNSVHKFSFNTHLKIH